MEVLSKSLVSVLLATFEVFSDFLFLALSEGGLVRKATMNFSTFSILLVTK